MLEQLYKVHKVLQSLWSLEKPKYILWNMLIKYNSSLGKSKKIRWGFQKVITILNDPLFITI